MGNQITATAATDAGRVILPDGSIHEFHHGQPLTAAELMVEHPNQVVVELSPTILLDKRPVRPLPADKDLEVNKVYIMVPLKKGKLTLLSSQETHKILVSANNILRSKSLITSSKFLPFFARICPSGSVVDSSSVFVSGAMNQVRVESLDSGHGDSGYMSRQHSGTGWRPSLDTIKEKKDDEVKVTHWVSLASKVGKRVQSKGLIWG